MSVFTDHKGVIVALSIPAITGAGLSPGVQPRQSEMTFFMTGAGPGDGANPGGLDAADAHCARLTAAAMDYVTAFTGTSRTPAG